MVRDKLASLTVAPSYGDAFEKYQKEKNCTTWGIEIKQFKDIHASLTIHGK